MSDDEFKRQLTRGREAEIAVSRWLQARGWYVLPTYDYSGLADDKAPKMEGLSRNLVIPDLLAAQFSKGACWLEVKRKTKADFTYTTGRHETGISLRLWNDYKDVQHETGLDASIIFVHEQEDEIRARKIRHLDNASCTHGRPGPSGTQPVRRDSSSARMGRMVFFCWDCLLPLARTSEVLRASSLKEVNQPARCSCGGRRVRFWLGAGWCCDLCQPMSGRPSTDWCVAA